MLPGDEHNNDGCDPAGLPRDVHVLVPGKDQVLHDAHNICMTKIMIMRYVTGWHGVFHDLMMNCK